MILPIHFNVGSSQYYLTQSKINLKTPPNCSGMVSHKYHRDDEATCHFIKLLFFFQSDTQIQIKKLWTHTTATAGLLHRYASARAAPLSPFVFAIRWRRSSAIEARLSAINSVERISHLYAQYPTKPNTPIEMKCAPGSAFHRGKWFVNKHCEGYILSSKLRLCIPNWPMRTARPKAENPRIFASSDMLLWSVGSSRNSWWLAKHGCEQAGANPWHSLSTLAL